MGGGGIPFPLPSTLGAAKLPRRGAGQALWMDGWMDAL